MQVQNNRFWCKISSFIVQPLFKMAIGTVAVIGAQLIVSISFPLRSEQWVTNGRVVLVLMFTWVLMGCLLMQEIFSPHQTSYMTTAFQCMPSYNEASDVKLIIWTNMTVNFISFLIIIVASVYTFTVLNRNRKKERAIMKRIQNKAGNRSNRSAFIGATVLILMCLDTSTWLPQYVFSSLRYLTRPTHPSHPRSHVFTALSQYHLRTAAWWIQYLSPALNPVIYALRLTEIRKEVARQARALWAVFYRSNSVNNVTSHVPTRNKRSCGSDATSFVI